MANSISYDDYKKLLAAGQKYVTQQQAADPEWSAFNQRAASLSAENMGELGPSPTKDYWSQYMGMLSPEQVLGFQQNMADSKSWTDKMTPIMKMIPYAVGGIGLAGASGLLAGSQLGSAAGFPASGSIFSGAGALGAEGLSGAGIGGGTAEGLASADLAGGLLPEFGTEAAYTAGLGSNAGWAAAPSLGGLGSAASTVAGTAPTGMSKWLTDMGVPSGVTDVLGKVPSNMWLPAIGGLLAGATADKGSSQKVDNTPGKSLLNYGQMTATAGQQMPQAQQPMMASKYQNSGLGRFGPGLFNPAPYSPTIYNWGKP